MAENQDTTDDKKIVKPPFETATEEMAAKVGTADTEVTAVQQQVQPGEILPAETAQLTTDPDKIPSVDPSLLRTGDMTAYQVTTPTRAADSTVGQISDTSMASTAMADLQDPAAARSEFTASDLIDIDDISSQTLSDQALATAATAELDERATVQFQLGELFKGIEDGKPLPAWASGPMRKAVAVMQQRGLGSSSMAAAAITQQLMESGVSIAAQDAQMYGAIQMKNLDNRQQAALQNALQVSAMDRQNADARTKAAISNAQALLSIDLKELDARQQSNTLKYSALTQAALTDAAAENARRQFNAKSELQVEEFFTELGVQIDTANINREIAVKQYNTNQANAYKEFNASMADQREKFNANMKFAIDQSNAQWRRQVNTANTAVQNETNRINVQNRYNASQTAMNQLWQMYRDNATFNFTAAESEKQRAHETMLKSLEVSATEKLYDDQQRADIAKNLNKVIGNW